MRFGFQSFRSSLDLFQKSGTGDSEYDILWSRGHLPLQFGDDLGPDLPPIVCATTTSTTSHEDPLGSSSSRANLWSHHGHLMTTNQRMPPMMDPAFGPVAVGHLLIQVNHKTTKKLGFQKTMQLLQSPRLPMVLRFRIPGSRVSMNPAARPSCAFGASSSMGLRSMAPAAAPKVSMASSSSHVFSSSRVIDPCIESTVFMPHDLSLCDLQPRMKSLSMSMRQFGAKSSDCGLQSVRPRRRDQAHYVEGLESAHESSRHHQFTVILESQEHGLVFKAFSTIQDLPIVSQFVVDVTTMGQLGQGMDLIEIGDALVAINEFKTKTFGVHKTLALLRTVRRPCRLRFQRMSSPHHRSQRRPRRGQDVQSNKESLHPHPFKTKLDHVPLDYVKELFAKVCHKPLHKCHFEELPLACIKEKSLQASRLRHHTERCIISGELQETDLSQNRRALSKLTSSAHQESLDRVGTLFLNRTNKEEPFNPGSCHDQQSWEFCSSKSVFSTTRRRRPDHKQPQSVGAAVDRADPADPVHSVGHIHKRRSSTLSSHHSTVLGSTANLALNPRDTSLSVLEPEEDLDGLDCDLFYDDLFASQLDQKMKEDALMKASFFSSLGWLEETREEDLVQVLEEAEENDEAEPTDRPLLLSELALDDDEEEEGEGDDLDDIFLEVISNCSTEVMLEDLER